MTSDCVTVSNNSCPVVGNNEYIVMFNFAGRRISGFEVIEAGLRSPPSPGQEGKKKKKKKKRPGLNSVKTTLENANRFNKC